MILESTVRERNISAPDSKTLAKWRRMTDRNAHREVRMLIARWFGDYDRAFAFSWLYSMMGGCPPLHCGRVIDPAALSCDLTTAMIRDIEMFFGRETADAVSSCL